MLRHVVLHTMEVSGTFYQVTKSGCNTTIIVVVSLQNVLKYFVKVVISFVGSD